MFKFEFVRKLKVTGIGENIPGFATAAQEKMFDGKNQRLKMS
jgi:hypothetical protein